MPENRDGLTERDNWIQYQRKGVSGNSGVCTVLCMDVGGGLCSELLTLTPPFQTSQL